MSNTVNTLDRVLGCNGDGSIGDKFISYCGVTDSEETLRLSLRAILWWSFKELCESHRFNTPMPSVLSIFGDCCTPLTIDLYKLLITECTKSVEDSVQRELLIQFPKSRILSYKNDVPLLTSVRKYVLKYYNIL